MSDLYSTLVNTQVGERIADLVGLPKPATLRRHDPEGPLMHGPVLLGGDGRLREPARSIMSAARIELHDQPAGPEDTPRYGGLVYDASGITGAAELVGLHAFFHTMVRRLGPSGRVIVLGGVPAEAADVEHHAAQRSLEGFVRSLAKELRAGGTAQLVEVSVGAEAGLGAPLRFLLSGRSAYVSGQRLTVGPATGTSPKEPVDATLPHDGRVAVVTGAAQGIGAAIATTLARDGAEVVCLDLPAVGTTLAEVANRVGGTALQLDITDRDAPAVLLSHLADRHDGVDIMVHNAGVTRDRTMAGMDRARWDLVMAVNLQAIEAIDSALLGSDVVRADGRIICVSSMSGIAGNKGQTNYSTSKAGVIGHVEAVAPSLTDGLTINAVAPGFIETAMTDAMPTGTRELGRRLNSLSQGGRPIDVAEAIGFFAGRDATWVNGTTLRVCGQNLLGA